jgi:hypothetical protein
MDIHPPEHPIRSLRDFGIHIFTITCGIIIALGLESLLQRHHEARLADKAREEFGVEIAENRASLTTNLAELQQDLQWLRAISAAATARLHHQAYQLPAEIQSRTFLRLSTTAWDTALATQAIEHLSFAEVRALSKVYAQETTLNELTVRARDQWVSLASYGEPSDWPDASEATVRHGLGDLHIAYSFADTIADSERQLLESYKKAEELLASRQ